MKDTYMLDNFILGNEYEISFNGEMQYCGIAQINVDDIDIAIGIMLDRQQSSYIYITNNFINCDHNLL